MKKMNKLFAVLVLFGMSGAAFGYEFTFRNTTDKTVNLAIRTGWGATSMSSTLSLRPGQEYAFKKIKNCLEEVHLNGLKQSVHKCEDASFNIRDFLGNLLATADDYEVLSTKEADIKDKR